MKITQDRNGRMSLEVQRPDCLRVVRVSQDFCHPKSQVPTSLDYLGTCAQPVYLLNYFFGTSP